MICTTVKKNVECALMTTNGCSYIGGVCHEIIDKCNDCSRKAEYNTGWYCTACPEPALKWRNGNCNLATHVSSVETKKKGYINPLKASKRGAR